MTALALALLAVAGRMTQIDRDLPAWHRTAGLIAFLLLLTYLVAGYLRQRPPPLGWLLVGVALVVGGSSLPDLAFTAVLCIVITVFEGLYGTAGSTARHTITAIVALPLVILFDRTLGAAQLGGVPWLILMGVSLSLTTVAVVVRSLFDLLERQIRAARRDAIIARTGTELIDETDLSRVDHTIQSATEELCQLAPGVGILTLRRTGNLLVVADQVGFPESIESVALPLPGPPATTEPATIVEPVGLSTLVGGSGQYEPGFHDSVNGPPEPVFDWPASFTNRLNTLIGETRHWRPIELPTTNGHGLVVVSGLHKVPDDTVEGFRALANLRALAQARTSSHVELVHLAHHDQLTGLPNRTCFLDELSRARAEGSLAAVLVLDLDNFRRINDTHGHDAGDKTLVAVAEELRKCLGDQAILARLAGDEFGIGADHATNAERLAERIGHRLRDPAVLRHPTGACIGIATADPALEPADLLRRADSAVQAAKDAGKGQIVHFVPGRHGNLTELRMIEEHLPHAASRGEILVYYQPNIDLLTRKCVGVEALARWSHPKLGMVSPGRFIPLAERTGHIASIGAHVLRTACQQVAEWSVLPGCENLQISVNVASQQLYDHRLVDLVADTLAKTGLAPNRLTLELTESGTVDNEHAQDQLERLADLGVRISVDDFGTGYASLATLNTISAHQVKIDRSFVSGERSDRGQRMVRLIVASGKILDLEVVAEGVETEQQAEELVRADVQYAQGFLFGRPMPARDFPAWLSGKAAGEATGTKVEQGAAAGSVVEPAAEELTRSQ